MHNRANPAPKYECALCGKRVAADEAIFSSWTRRRFCRDTNACDNRVARKATRLRVIA